MKREIELTKYTLDLAKALDNIVKIEEVTGFTTIERHDARKYRKKNTK